VIFIAVGTAPGRRRRGTSGVGGRRPRERQEPGRDEDNRHQEQRPRARHASWPGRWPRSPDVPVSGPRQPEFLKKGPRSTLHQERPRLVGVRSNEGPPPTGSRNLQAVPPHGAASGYDARSGRDEKSTSPNCLLATKIVINEMANLCEQHGAESTTSPRGDRPDQRNRLQLPSSGRRLRRQCFTKDHPAPWFHMARRRAPLAG